MGLAHRLHNIMSLALPFLPRQHLMFLNKMWTKFSSYNTRLMIRDLQETIQLLLRRLDERSRGGQVPVPYNQPSHDRSNEY